LKLSKTSWLVIIIGVFIILLAGLGIIRSNQVQEQNNLKDTLGLTQLKLQTIQLEQFPQRQEELEKQLSQTMAESESARSVLSQPIGSIMVSALLFDLAEANSVNITEVSSAGMTDSNLEGVPCLALSFGADVTGEVANLVNFITSLNNELRTGVVSSTEINIPESGGMPSARIQLVVYTHEGA
jgi:hypothetical protein